MKYLIFRTDRIGDFLITSPLINAIKNNDTDAEIYVASSNKNKEFIINYNFVNRVFLLKKNNILNIKTTITIGIKNNFFFFKFILKI